jgi:ABC-type glycerol-3-phosphate transport system substrate-binding protein
MSENGKLSRRQMLKLTAIGSTAALLAACAPGEPAQRAGGSGQTGVAQTGAVEVSAEATEIVYWASWTGLFEEMVKRIANGFMEKNPDIKVTHLVIPGAEMDAKILTSVAAGDPPDVCMIWGAQRVYTLAELGGLYALEDALDPNQLSEFKDWVHPPMWDLGTYKGKTWAIPQWNQAYCNIWNTRYLEEAGYDPTDLDSLPKTTDEMRAFSEKTTKFRDDGSLEEIGFRDDWINRQMAIWHGEFFNPDQEEFLINSEENVTALTWMADMEEFYGREAVAGFFEQQAGAAQGTMDLLLGGKLSVRLDGPWRLGVIGETAPDFDYVVTPVHTTGNLSRSLWTYGDIPCIIKQGKHINESARYVTFLCGFGGEEEYSSLYMPAPEGGGRPHCPISKKLTETAAWKRVLDAYPGYDQFMKTFFEADYTLVPAKVPISSYVNTRIASAAEAARTGMLSPQLALDQAQDDIVKEYDRWLAENT